ncbi:hypothetical protein NDU88_007143 [Pleurodeles waltl]|uniref:Uncharacterized protein n=1 Tax=Pleurodeles waltl TaxID=8319 RepID=A0AAV7RS45_PLEWA|nr:hypothetical protein NDU88_007143 [Pleurodeles waltl]
MRGTRGGSAHQPPQGEGAQDPLSSAAPGPGPGPPSPPEPTPGARLSRGAQPRAQRSSPGPSRRRDSPAASSARSRSSGPSLGAPARGVRNTAPDSISPRLRPPLGSPSLGAALSRADSAPLSPLGPTLTRAPSGVGFLPTFQPRVPRHSRTHKGSPRFPLRVQHGLAFRADDGGVQSTLRVRPPS